MDIYRLGLYLGFTGIVSMALLGIGQLGHGHTGTQGNTSGHGHGGHGGHANGPAGHGGHGHAAQGHGSQGHSTHSHSKESRDSGADRWGLVLGLLSPRVFFSFLLGFGATGILLKHFLPEDPVVDWLATKSWIQDAAMTYRIGRLVLAGVGGWAFEHWIVASIWNFIFRFASNPARTLDTAICEEARAVTNFDASGSGLIALDLDGQIMQVLGTLNAAERAEGIRIHAGDLLFVEAVDTQRNSCTVSRINRDSIVSV